MNKIVKTSLLALGAAMVTQALQAQVTEGDFVVGFTKSGSSDYVVDIGAPTTTTALNSTIAVGYTNTFSSLAASGVSVGVVGAWSIATGDANGNAQIFMSTIRTGVDPTSFAVPGSESAPSFITDNQNHSAISTVLGLTTGTTTTWTAGIAKDPSTVGTYQNSFASYLGQNPMVAVNASGVTTLDIWSEEDTGYGTAWTYAGNLQVDLTGATPVMTFDVAPVPEPTTCSLLGGLGVLALTFRRKFSRNNA